MQFRVLGPLQVLGAGGRQVRMHSAAQRRLVGLLVLHAGTTIPSDTLSEALGLSAGALRTSICRLRRIVGYDTLVTSPPGYELRSVDTDARRFEELLATARDSSASDGPTQNRSDQIVRSSLEHALELWRGEAYQEFAHEYWALAESRRLEELRNGALEDLVELLIETREWSAAIAQLEPLIADRPFSDRPRSLLMRALADSGRRADALRAFQDYRALLGEQVGTEPSPPLVELDRTIASAGG